MTPQEAVQSMVEGGDHSYYTPEFATEVQTAFGMEPRTQTQVANTRDPKGLFVEGVGPYTRVPGYASHDLAEAIASHLGLHGVWERMMGRGSRERAALAAIRQHLQDTGQWQAQ